MLQAPVYPKEPNKLPLPLLPYREGNGKKRDSLTILLDSKIEYLFAEMRKKELRDEAVNRQHLLLEASIVGLIIVEVILFCYDLFFKTQAP